MCLAVHPPCVRKNCHIKGGNKMSFNNGKSNILSLRPDGISKVINQQYYLLSQKWEGSFIWVPV